MTDQLMDPAQLRRIRKSLGFTQAGLAKLSGVSQSVIAKVESGDADPTYTTLLAISRGLSTAASKSGKRASDVMTAPVIGVQGSSTLAECVKTMKRNSISQMPVFSGRRMVGTITEGEIMGTMAAAKEPGEVLRQKVSDHILPSFAVVGRDTPVEAVASLLRFLPAVLVASGEEVVGIITKIDVLAGTQEGGEGRRARPLRS